LEIQWQGFVGITFSPFPGPVRDAPCTLFSALIVIDPDTDNTTEPLQLTLDLNRMKIPATPANLNGTTWNFS
jgi:hypothetical protein